MDYKPLNNEHYIVITYDEAMLWKLKENVNYLIEIGYIPIGGISVRTGPLNGAYLMQAMLKKDD